ncbi:MAG: hypothetical protein DKM50_09625 [Candidatus Margulisiibacteriota bacterium]|nr:MAG: hypothetical protein DKM50_09625 [Candidatus Margulisiibacteriota bacterium]HCY36932.1 hypothetical protein [Candidatus Margulisiibacteriota bacterium]
MMPAANERGNYMKIKNIAIIGLVVTVAMFTMALTEKPNSSNASKSKQVATGFDRFNLTNAEGTGKQNVGALISGKAAIINIWATWCPPCRAEIPDLVEVYNKYKNKNVVIVGISVDSDSSSVKAFVKENKITYPLLMDDGSISEEFGVRGIPTTLFVNRKGRVVNKKVGYADKQFFTSQVEEMLKE